MLDRDTGLLRWRALVEYVQGNLFMVPTLLVVVAVVLAQATIALDSRIGTATGFPDILRSTVDSARALLSTIAGATITFSGISFSISLLLIQLASSQFSPRVLYGFFRDPFTKWVMGFVVGTFAYCLLVLRVVRSPTEEGGDPVIPSVSVLVATFLGVLSIVAVVALINHVARSMQVGEIVNRITERAREQIAGLPRLDRGEGSENAGRREDAPGAARRPEPEPPPGMEVLVVEAGADGWVQQIDRNALLAQAPEGGTVLLHIRVGGFVSRLTPLCRIWPAPEDPGRAVEECRDAIRLGGSRTMQQDIGFGFRQLVDIALRALSPGINDATTAQEVIVHVGSLLRELLPRRLPPAEIEDDRGRRLVQPRVLTVDDHVDHAFDQIRASAAPNPAVTMTLLQTIGMLVQEAGRLGLEDRAPALRRQARLAVEASQSADLHPADLEQVRATAAVFGLEPHPERS